MNCILHSFCHNTTFNCSVFVACITLVYLSMLVYKGKCLQESLSLQFLLRDAMHKCGPCRHAVSVCLSVCLSVCHIRELRQNE